MVYVSLPKIDRGNPHLPYRADRAAERPGFVDFQQTTNLSTDYKSPWALIVHKAPTRRLIGKQWPKATFSKDKSSIRLQEFQQTTIVSTDYDSFN